jgi:signal transduction histidine kinase
VSQALFGVVLGSRTALHRIAEAPAEAEDPMKYVLSLAEAALAEMRALIFELRPESLQQQGLIGAFRKQAEALCARHKIDVRVDFDAREPDLSLEQKEALYRIALEAIQNTIKHAHATRVDLVLRQTAEALHMEVIDNGLGFDTTVEHVGHYGLHTMRERIVRFGGEASVVSKLGEGTIVRVWMPLGVTPQKQRQALPGTELLVA